MTDQAIVKTDNNLRIPAFGITDVIKNSWDKSKGNRMLLWGALLIYFVLMLIVGVVQAVLFGSESDSIFSALYSMASSAFSCVLFSGIIYMGILCARGEKISIEMLFSQFNKFLNIIIAYVLMGIAVFIGFLLLIVPGIYLAVSYSLVLPLIIDQNLKPWEALETSRKLVTSQWFSFVAVFIVWSVIVMISAIPFGLGLIWTVPTGMILIGELYYLACNKNPLEPEQI